MASSPSSSEASCKSEHGERSPSCSPTPLSLNQSSTSGSPSNNPPPVRASAHKKDKKNVREKRRRGELNRKFETLRELLAVGEGKAKVEKSHILSEAITAIEALKKRNHELMMLVNQLNGGSNNPQSNMNQLRANPLLTPSAALSPFLNMLPNLPLNSAPANDASIANSTLLAQMASTFRPQQNQQSPQSANQQQSVLTQPTHAFMSQLSQLGVSNPSMSLNNASTNTPTPLPYGNNQQQSFPTFAAQQMSPSLAFQQQLHQQFAQQQLAMQQQQQHQHQQQSMSLLNSNQPPNMLGAAQSLTRGSSHASLNDPHTLNNQQQNR